MGSRRPQRRRRSMVCARSDGTRSTLGPDHSTLGIASARSELASPAVASKAEYRARGASLRAPQSRAKPSIEREERACEPRSREQSRVSSARSELASPAVASKAEYRARGASLRAPQCDYE